MTVILGFLSINRLVHSKWTPLPMKIFVFNVNTHQKVILAEDDFNYQVI